MARLSYKEVDKMLEIINKRYFDYDKYGTYGYNIVSYFKDSGGMRTEIVCSTLREALKAAEGMLHAFEVLHGKGKLY